MADKRTNTADMKKMQEEAIKRVMEMYARSKPTKSTSSKQKSLQTRQNNKAKIENSKNSKNSIKSQEAPKKRRGRPPGKIQNPNNINQNQKKRTQKPNSKNLMAVKNLLLNENNNFAQHTKKPNPFNNIMSGLPNLVDVIFKDQDRSLLIVLIILLMDDEENFPLLLVIFYLLI